MLETAMRQRIITLRRAGLVFALCMCVTGAAETSGILLDVPYARQPKDGCGAACISMVLQYWSRHDSSLPRVWPGVASIQRALYDPPARGISAGSMEGYFRRKGWRVFAFHGDWHLLEEHLSKGRPLIVCLGEGRMLHYVVVAGMEPSAAVVLVNDPAGHKLTPLHRSNFEKKWSVEDNWTLLVLPRSRE